MEESEQKKENEERVYEFTSDLNISAVKNTDPDAESLPVPEVSLPTPKSEIKKEEPKPEYPEKIGVPQYGNSIDVRKETQTSVPEQKISPPAHVSVTTPKEEPVTKREPDKEKAIRTLEGDIAEYMAKNNISTTTMVIAEKEKKDKKTQPIPVKPEPTKPAEPAEPEPDDTTIDIPPIPEQTKLSEKLNKFREEEAQELVDMNKDSLNIAALQHEQKVKPIPKPEPIPTPVPEPKNVPVPVPVPVPIPKPEPEPEHVELGHFQAADSTWQTKNTDQPTEKSTPSAIEYTQSDLDEVELPKQSGKKIFFVLLSMIFVLGGIIVAYYLYSISALAVKVPVNLETELGSPIISVDSRATLDVSSLSNTEIISALRQAVNVDSTPNTIQDIVLTETIADTTTRLTSTDILGKMSITVPDTLARSLSGPWMVGIYTDQNGSKDVFVIAKHSFFQNAFSGMISWEKTMINDLKDYLFQSQEDFTTRGQFVDGIVGNKDVRAYISEKGSLVILYSLIDNEKIVFATKESTIKEIIQRLERQAYIR